MASKLSERTGADWRRPREAKRTQPINLPVKTGGDTQYIGMVFHRCVFSYELLGLLFERMPCCMLDIGMASPQNGYGDGSLEYLDGRKICHIYCID